MWVVWGCCGLLGVGCDEIDVIGVEGIYVLLVDFFGVCYVVDGVVEEVIVCCFYGSCQGWSEVFVIGVQCYGL